MPLTMTSVLATFTSPTDLGTNPVSMLLLLPLLLAIAIVYKATKVHNIQAKSFFKEVSILFGWMLGCTILAAVVLCTFAWLVLS